MSKPIIVAVDETQLSSFRHIVDSLDSNLCMIKIGSASFNAIGHDAIESRDAVGCDKEVLVSQIKYFPHFARLEVFQPRKADIQTSGSTQ